MENLQEALSDLQLAVESSGKADACSAHAATPRGNMTCERIADSGPTIADIGIDMLHSGQPDLQQSHTLQSPSVNLPTSSASCMLHFTMASAKTIEPRCTEVSQDKYVSCSAAAASAPTLSAIDVGIRTPGSTAIMCRTPGTMHIITSTDEWQSEHRTPAGVRLDLAVTDIPTPYFTPCTSSSPTHQSTSCQLPTEEQWFTPISMECSDYDASDVVDSELVPGIGKLHTADLIPSCRTSRLESCSLPYEQGSTFSTDVLEEMDGLLGQWLSQ